MFPSTYFAPTYFAPRYFPTTPRGDVFYLFGSDSFALLAADSAQILSNQNLAESLTITSSEILIVESNVVALDSDNLDLSELIAASSDFGSIEALTLDLSDSASGAAAQSSNDSVLLSSLESISVESQGASIEQSTLSSSENATAQSDIFVSDSSRLRTTETVAILVDVFVSDFFALSTIVEFGEIALDVLASDSVLLNVSEESEVGQVAILIWLYGSLIFEQLLSGSTRTFEYLSGEGVEDIGMIGILDVPPTKLVSGVFDVDVNISGLFAATIDISGVHVEGEDAMAKNQNFSMFADNDVDLVCTVKDQADAVVDLTGCDVEWRLMTSQRGDLVIFKSLAAGIVIMDQTGSDKGKYVISLNRRDSAALSGEYYHYSTVKTAAGKKTTVFYGKAEIK